MFVVIGLFRDFRDFKEGEIQAWATLKWLTRSPIEVDKVNIDKLAALSTAYYKGALIVLKKWTPNTSLMDYDFSWGTLWVRIEGLPLHINQVHVASNLLERFGTVLYFDGKIRRRKTKWIRFRYEGVFVFYMNCGRIGHKDSYYKKSPQKAKKDIIRVMNNLCIEENDRIINEDSIIPVYSRNIGGLKGTPGNKTTTINLVQPTQLFKPEDVSESSDSEDEDDKDDSDEKEDERLDKDHDPEPVNSEEGDGGPNGDPGPSRKRPSSSNGSNSSGSSSEFGHPSRRRKLEFHERILREEVNCSPPSRKRKSSGEEQREQGKRMRKNPLANHARTGKLWSMSLVGRRSSAQESVRGIKPFYLSHGSGFVDWAGFYAFRGNGPALRFQVRQLVGRVNEDNKRKLNAIVDLSPSGNMEWEMSGMLIKDRRSSKFPKTIELMQLEEWDKGKSSNWTFGYYALLFPMHAYHIPRPRLCFLVGSRRSYNHFISSITIKAGISLSHLLP
ncbi:hypothetical protein RDABS01_003843 [Bienertia sinuspersici]